MAEAFDDGFEFHKLKPDLMLIEVWRRANDYARPFPIPDQTEDDARQLARAFVEGYQAARKQRDEHNAEGV